MMQKRIQMHQRVGFSGLMGGFMEDRRYLDGVGREFMPEDHPNEAARKVFTDKIAKNPQWAWPYKIKAAAMVARYLMLGSEFADERRREAEEQEVAGSESQVVGQQGGASAKSKSGPSAT